MHLQCYPITGATRSSQSGLYSTVRTSIHVLLAACQTYSNGPESLSENCSRNTVLSEAAQQELQPGQASHGCTWLNPGPGLPANLRVIVGRDALRACTRSKVDVADRNLHKKAGSPSLVYCWESFFKWSHICAWHDMHDAKGASAGSCSHGLEVKA